MTTPVPLATVLRKINDHRIEVRRSGNAALERTWDALEDYMTRVASAGCAVEKDKE